jgi:hypothetical protein
MKKNLDRSLIAAAAVLVLSACGGGGSGGFPVTAAPTQQSTATTTPPVLNSEAPVEPIKEVDVTPEQVTTKLSGVAATGAPVANGNVTVQCASGSSVTTTTDAAGAWSATLTDQAFPCLVSVAGGSLPSGRTLYSIASDASSVNVTPLTSLVVASAAKAAPETVAAGGLGAVAELLPSAQTKVNAMLKASGYTPLTGNAFTSVFEPKAGDAHDDLIAQLMRSLADEGVTLERLVTDVAAAGDAGVPVPHTHVFKSAEIAGLPQPNKATLSIADSALKMTLGTGSNDVGSYVGGGNGNKAILQLPGLDGMKLIDFKDMTLDLKGVSGYPNSGYSYVYVNFLVDLNCDGSALPANATLDDLRVKRRIVIYDPFVKFIQQNPTGISATEFSKVNFSRATGGWRVSAGTPVGAGVAIGQNYQGNETLQSFDFATYPNACIVNAASGDNGMFRDAAADPACATSGPLATSAPAACGKAHSGAMVVLGDSYTTKENEWQVKKVRLNVSNPRNFVFGQ